jgi:hypothetical protein
MSTVTDIFLIARNGTLENIMHNINASNVNSFNPSGKHEPLIVYVSKYNTEENIADIFIYLIEIGADVNAKDDDGKSFITVFTLMIEDGNRYLNMCIERGCLPGKIRAIQEYVQSLKNVEKKINLKERLSSLMFLESTQTHNDQYPMNQMESFFSKVHNQKNLVGYYDYKTVIKPRSRSRSRTRSGTRLRSRSRGGKKRKIGSVTYGRT